MRYLLLVILGLSIGAVAQSPWPGQSGNAVGYAAYGSLNDGVTCAPPSSGSSWATRVIISNCYYSTYQTISANYIEFDSVDFYGTGTTGGTLISGSNILFKGCRFQSNNQGNYNVQITGANVFMVYPSIVPLASFATSPPGAAWPSAGAGGNTTTQVSGTNAIIGSSAYQYGINIPSGGGPAYITGMDMWGFANAATFFSSNSQTIVNSWMHDARYAATYGDHTDGPGYLNGTAAPSNVTLQGNTNCSIGNTQGVAYQGSTSGYANMQTNYNYLCGYGYTAAFFPGASPAPTNSYIGHNVLGTDLAEVFGPLYNNAATLGTGAWGCNTISFLAGTTWVANWTPTSAANGQYWVENSTPNSATDQGGNTHCGNLSKSSLLWLPSATNQKTVTLTAGNTGNIGSISISLATGTQFSQTNTCGSSIANGANCTITVTYAPTGTGPVTDVLKISDNDPSSPEIIPLLGIDTPSTSGSFTCSPSTVPANHSGHIALTCTATGGLTWSGGTVFTVTGVSGTSLVSYSNNSSTSETVTITTGSGTGTLTVTDTTDSLSTTITVATASLSISPNSGNVSTTPSVTLTGTNTLWSSETASTLFSVSGAGCSGESLATPTVGSNTSATSTLTAGSGACNITVTDNSTTATTIFTVNSLAPAQAGALQNGANLLNGASIH